MYARAISMSCDIDVVADRDFSVFCLGTDAMSDILPASVDLGPFAMVFGAVPSGFDRE